MVENLAGLELDQTAIAEAAAAAAGIEGEGGFAEDIGEVQVLQVAGDCQMLVAGGGLDGNM